MDCDEVVVADFAGEQHAHLLARPDRLLWPGQLRGLGAQPLQQRRLQRWLFHRSTVAAETSWTGRSLTRGGEQHGRVSLLRQDGQSGQYRGVLAGDVGRRDATVTRTVTRRLRWQWVPSTITTPPQAQQAASSRQAEASACALTACTPSSPGSVSWCWS